MTWEELIEEVKDIPGIDVSPTYKGHTNYIRLIKPDSGTKRQYVLDFFEDGAMFILAWDRSWVPVIRSMTMEEVLQIIKIATAGERKCKKKK